MKKTITLEFNDKTTSSYTFNNLPAFTPPYYQQEFETAANMLFEAINSMTQNYKSDQYTFKNLDKINGQEINHYLDMENSFGVPVFNEIVICDLLQYFSAPEENTEMQSAGEVANSGF